MKFLNFDIYFFIFMINFQVYLAVFCFFFLGGGGQTGHFRPFGGDMALNFPPPPLDPPVGLRGLYVSLRGPI